MFFCAYCTKLIKGVPWLVAGLIQLLVLLLVIAAVPWLPVLLAPPYELWWFALAQGVLAAGVSAVAGLPRWWWLIQLVMPLVAVWGLEQQQVPVWVFALLFLLMLLTFSRVGSDRVPLYLSNQLTRQALVQLVQERVPGGRVLDLGSGLGGVVRALSRAGVRAEGVEASPLLWLVSAFWSRLTASGAIHRADLWQVSLAQVDMVYAFLSPVPMPALWQKVCAEMRPGAVLVSNSFAVPDVDPDEVWELADGRQTRLYIYVIPPRA